MKIEAASKGIPDMKKDENVHNGTVKTAAWVVTLCIAVFTFSWATCAEVHGYRLLNITTRLGTQENRLMSMIDVQKDKDAAQDLERSRNTSLILQLIDTVQEIKADVKTLLRDVP